MSTTNISAAHRAALTFIQGKEGVALFSCFRDGEPTAAIVRVSQLGKHYHIEPLFVAVDPEMVLTDHDGKAVA